MEKARPLLNIAINSIDTTRTGLKDPRAIRVTYIIIIIADSVVATFIKTIYSCIESGFVVLWDGSPYHVWTSFTPTVFAAIQRFERKFETSIGYDRRVLYFTTDRRHRPWILASAIATFSSDRTWVGCSDVLYRDPPEGLQQHRA